MSRTRTDGAGTIARVTQRRRPRLRLVILRALQCANEPAMKHRLAVLMAVTVAIAAGQHDPRVQAFIPMLNPARRVAVVYPESARPTELRGVVWVLVAFDLAGMVIQAEALTGRS